MFVDTGAFKKTHNRGSQDEHKKDQDIKKPELRSTTVLLLVSISNPAWFILKPQTGGRLQTQTSHPCDAGSMKRLVTVHQLREFCRSENAAVR